MKLLLFILLFPLTGNWGTDLEAAKKQAAAEHKLILLNFSGSDWCGPCMAMKRDFFENQQFIAYADSHLVLVNADFPRKKKNLPGEEVIKKNNALAEIYNTGGNFPKTLLLDAEGNIIFSWVGKPDGSPGEWITSLKSAGSGNN